jgi:hypothetical protein
MAKEKDTVGTRSGQQNVEFIKKLYNLTIPMIRVAMKLVYSPTSNVYHV